MILAESDYVFGPGSVKGPMVQCLDFGTFHCLRLADIGRFHNHLRLRAIAVT